MKKNLIVLFIFLLSTVSVYAGNKDKDNYPENVKVIAQSASDNSFIVTVIDLDNNEIVIVSYIASNGFLSSVIRTGWIVNPDDYPTISEK